MKKLVLILAAVLCLVSCGDGVHFPEVSDISLDVNNKTIYAGETFKLNATVSPYELRNTPVTWTSSDEAVATVDGDGIVTGIAKGETTITAKAGDKTATCTVNVIPLTITFHANGGTGSMDDQTVSYGIGADLRANTFIKSGSVFAKWNTKEDGSGADYVNGENVTLFESMELYAIWVPDVAKTSYTVYHYIEDLGATTFTLGVTEVVSDQTPGVLVLLSNLKDSIEGFTYSEGFDEAPEDPTVKPSTGAKTATTVLPDGKRFIYLYYSRDSHAVTLTRGNGITGASGAGTYEYGQTVNLDATFAQGYVWGNWTDTDTRAVVSPIKAYSFMMGTEDVCLTANSTPITYTVTFDKNSTSATGTMANQILTYDETRRLNKNEFARDDGYSFEAWNTAPEGSGESIIDEGLAVNLSKTQGDVVILYAQWKQNPVVTFHGNYATSGSMEPQVVPYFISTNLTANMFVREGYIFSGWNTKADGSGTSYADEAAVTLTENLDLYAQWNKNPVVTFYGNYATSGSMEPQVVTYNTTTNLKANEYVRNGYIFTGWNTKADGSGTSYADKAAVTLTDKSLDLYAQWKIDAANNPLTIKNTSGDSLTVTFSNDEYYTTTVRYEIYNGDSYQGEGTVILDSETGHSKNVTVPRGFRIRIYSNRSSMDRFNINCDKSCSVFGNVMSLIYSENFKGQKGINFMAAFQYLFKDNDYIDIDPTIGDLVLPATSLSDGCYYAMFFGCSSLTRAPELPATDLSVSCYDNMFRDCEKLEHSPVLPATSLTSNSYYQMFSGCENLKSITCMATYVSAYNCIEGWVDGVHAGTGDRIFYKNPKADFWRVGNNVPTGWTIKNR